MNIDAEAAAHAHREHIIGPLRGVLPEATVAHMEEQLAGGCTIEVAAFAEFTKLLAEAATKYHFSHVVFDTTPTGYTVRLLQSTKAWARVLSPNSGDTSCAGSLARVQEVRDLHAAAVAALGDLELTTVVLVSRPHHTVSEQVARTQDGLTVALVPWSPGEPAGADRVAQLLRQVRVEAGVTASWLQEIRDYWSQTCGQCEKARQ